MKNISFKAIAIGALVAGAIIAQSLISSSPAQAGTITSVPFTPSCAAGFKPFAVKKAKIGGVNVVVSFKCRTAWFKCPNIPNHDTTRMLVDVKRKGGGDANVKTRVVYECFGQDIAG